MITIKEILDKYHGKLDWLDLEVILAEVLKKDRAFVISHPEYKPNKRQSAKAVAYINRRLAHEPMAYILGHKEFYGLDFAVNRHTLIPRPETELLVEKTLERVRNFKHTKLALIDIGTGSGNIIISVAKNISTFKLSKEIKFIATDISDGALRVAKKNSVRYNLSKRIKFFKSDILSGLKSYLLKNNISEIIFVSNLPYLSKNIYSNVAPDIKKFEPRETLVSGDRGLAHYKKFFLEIKTLKNYRPTTEINFFIEFSPEQKMMLEKFVKKTFPRSRTNFHKDFSGRFRIASVWL